MNRNLAFLTLALLLTLTAAAQQFGAFPARTRWRQLNSDTARVIFTPGSEHTASRVSALLHRAAADTPLALGSRMRKINVVLHSRTTIANGYVALGPFRSEFYLIPGSNVYEFGNLPWADNLAIHEYRHVQQYNNFRNGLSKAMFYLFGEGGQDLANALSVPDWFFEGDAVHNETALSNSGRGRLPFFLSGYRSLWLEGRNYSWMKLRNGSFKDYVPNHYQLGYLLANYGYARYGDEFWKKVTRDASAFKGLLYPFQQAVRRHSGVDFRTFRKQAFDWYREQTAKAQPVEVKPERTATSYFFPQAIGTDSLLFLKRAYDRIPTFFIRANGMEKSVKRQSISSEEWFSHRNGTVAYTAYSTHPRWTLVDYSDIVLLDLASRKERRITKGARYFTPDLSPSGARIVAVRINDSLQTDLVTLNREGAVQSIVRGNRDRYFLNPRFLNEHEVVVSVRDESSRMSLQRVALADGSSEVLIPPTYLSMYQPFVTGDTVLFTANITGNDDLFALSLRSKEVYQLTQRSTGTYFPSVGGDSLAYSVFTGQGLALQTMDRKNALWTRVDPAAFGRQPELYPVAGAQRGFTNTLVTRPLPSEPYAKTSRLFNFHSWRPDYADPEFQLSVYSDNILNTFSNELFYRYNRNERSHGFGWNTIWGGWFAQISAGVEYTTHRLAVNRFGNLFPFNQFEQRLGYSIPLTFTRGRSYKLLQFGSDIVNSDRAVQAPFKDSIRIADLQYLRHFLTWAHYRPRAVQQIYPRLGYTVSSTLRHRVDQRTGKQLLATGQVFLPSFRNHSLVLYGQIQELDTFGAVFSNRFSRARGYEANPYFARAWRLSGNYHFPIAYPDWGAANIVYFLRVRGNLFYDYARHYNPAKTAFRNLRSTGVEVFFDTKWWNQLPLTLGVQAAYLLDRGFSSVDRKGRINIEVALPLNLIPD